MQHSLKYALWKICHGLWITRMGQLESASWRRTVPSIYTKRPRSFPSPFSLGLAHVYACESLRMCVCSGFMKIHTPTHFAHLPFFWDAVRLWEEINMIINAVNFTSFLFSFAHIIRVGHIMSNCLTSSYHLQKKLFNHFFLPCARHLISISFTLSHYMHLLPSYNFPSVKRRCKHVARKKKSLLDIINLLFESLFHFNKCVNIKSFLSMVH